MTYLIKVAISGGVTGRRESYMKRDGYAQQFETQADAQREINHLIYVYRMPPTVTVTYRIVANDYETFIW